MRRDERQLDGRNLAYRIDAVSKYNTLMMIDNVLWHFTLISNVLFDKNIG